MRVMIMLATLMFWAASASAGELKQVAFQHDGECDGTFHVVPFFDNVTSRPVRIAQGMILNGGTGEQGAYLGRRSDGFFFAPAGIATAPGTALHTIRAGDSLTLQPGDGLNLIHWCYPPDRYAFWAIVDYTD